MKNTIIYLILILVGSFFIGCGGCASIHNLQLNDYNKKLLKEGYNPEHVWACGSSSIEYLKPKIDQQNISKDILNHRTTLNKIIIYLSSTINWRAEQITFPEEMKQELERQGFNVIVVEGTDENLKKILNLYKNSNQQGIAFIKDENSEFDYHYEKFPSPDDITKFYKNTIIKKIYLIN